MVEPNIDTIEMGGFNPLHEIRIAVLRVRKVLRENVVGKRSIYEIRRIAHAVDAPRLRLSRPGLVCNSASRGPPWPPVIQLTT